MDLEIPILEDHFVADRVPGEAMDILWSLGWRHFGPYFFRYSLSEENGQWQVVQPLRIQLAGDVESKRHRRVRRRNLDLEWRIKPARIDDERRDLFHIHKQRFERNVPEEIENFLGFEPGECPCEMVEVAAYADGRLAAASYLDIGRESVSSIYAMFDPQHARRGLGIATMLWEMAYARERGFRLYYPGYAFHEPSYYDYKKQFGAMEWFDWRGNWLALRTDILVP